MSTASPVLVIAPDVASFLYVCREIRASANFYVGRDSRREAARYVDVVRLCIAGGHALYNLLQHTNAQYELWLHCHVALFRQLEHAVREDIQYGVRPPSGNWEFSTYPSNRSCSKRDRKFIKLHIAEILQHMRHYETPQRWRYIISLRVFHVVLRAVWTGEGLFNSSYSSDAGPTEMGSDTS